MPRSVRSSQRSPTHELLQEETLPLNAVMDLIPRKRRRRAYGFDAFDSVPPSWGSYYQSLVRKAAGTQENVFRFDENGALAADCTTNAHAFLCDWLKLTSGEGIGLVDKWLHEGTALNEGLYRRLRHRLEDDALAETDLYNRHICRLVQVDQLRYDPDYTAVYQLTPAQVSLIKDQTDPAGEWAGKDGGYPPALARMRRNQRMYWMISERFQSSIALFDSDLGRDGPFEDGTKNLLHIHRDPNLRQALVGPGGKSRPTAPHRLNQYSPLRFWSPPPAFGRYVFHMLFWQPLVTGRDLYGREFPDDIQESVGKFRVALNVYNSSKYRIADYSGLLRLIEALSRAFSIRGEGQKLAGLQDIELKDRSFYPRRLAHHPLVGLPKGRVYIPLQSLGEERWELASRYQQPGEATEVRHMLKMLRDRALEIMLWSRYQMEIRSVGMVPVQRLYRVELAPAGVAFVERLRELMKLERFDELDDVFRAQVFSGRLASWVSLKKEYVRTHNRRMMDDGVVRWLKTQTERERDDSQSQKPQPPIRRIRAVRRR